MEGVAGTQAGGLNAVCVSECVCVCICECVCECA